MNARLQPVRAGNMQVGLMLSALLMLLGSASAAAQCVSATVTTQTELEATVLDYNANCGNGDVLTATVSGTITISGSALSDISNATTALFEIVGDGDDVLDGSGAFHLLDIDDGFVNIDGLTLRNGYHPSQSGGAISNRSAAFLAINNSTFSGNQAESYGGAILTYGALTVTNSTFIDNGARQASAIQIFRGLTTIENSTFAGNTGGGVILVFGGSSNAVITNSTVSGNTGSVGRAGILVAQGSVSLQNSIIAKNAAGSDCSSVNGGTVIFSPGRTNVMDANHCGTAGTDYLTADPLLGALSDNGGNVQTFALLPGSPAINAGNNAAAAGLSTDARGAGFARIVSGTVDIGAFESQQATEVRFVSGAAAGSEASAVPNVLTLTTSDGNSTKAPVMIDLAVTGGTLTDDYTAVSPFTIPSGTASGTPLPIPGFAIVNDVDEEPDEDLTLSLNNASGATLGTPATMVYTVENDDTAPLVVRRVPNHQDDGVAITSSIELTFNEPVSKAGTGLIQIVETGVGIFKSYDLSVPDESARINVSGSVATIDPAVDFAELTNYHVLISSNAFTNQAGTGFSGYSAQTQYNFTTDDATPPEVTTLVPADDAINVDIDLSGTRNLRVSFNEQVGSAGGGFISVFRSLSNTLVEAVPFDDPSRVEFFLNSPTDGGFFVDLQVPLEEQTEYYVQIDAGAVVDAANNPNPFPGITDTTSWSFTTGDFTNPAPVSRLPGDDAIDVPLTSDFSLTFDENIQPGVGNISLFAGTPQELFRDPLDDASLLNVTRGNFFAVSEPSFDPDPIFGINDGTGGGDFGGDTPGDRTVYNGFAGGFMEANGVALAGPPEVVVEWQNIDITGAINLQFNARFASALRPDINDYVRIEAIIDGGGPVEILSFISIAQAGVFRASDSGTVLNDTAQDFSRPITGTGTSLTIRATLSLSGTDDSGDDIAIDDVVISASGIGSSALIEQVTAGAANLTIAGDQLTFNPTADLMPFTDYYITMNEGAVTDTSLNANPFVGILDTQWNVTSTDDVTAPAIVGLSPADDATNVATTPNLTATFDETVLAGTGNITIRSNSDHSTVETIAIGSPLVTIAGDTVTIDPTSLLQESAEYYVQMDAGAVTDDVGNPFSGIVDTTIWSFTTGDFTPPVFVTLEPADDATRVALDTNLTLTYNEAVQPGVGNVTIHLSSDDSVVETIAIGAGNVMFAGNTITIDPAMMLLDLTPYYVQVQAGAIEDTSGNDAAGILSPAGWCFTTGDFSAPVLLSVSPPNDATGVTVDTTLQLAFDEVVQPGTGEITIHRSSDGSVIDTIAIGSPNAIFAGNSVALNPSVTLAESTQYDVQVGAGVILDASLNAFPGIVGSTTWRFTTGDFSAPTVLTINPPDDATEVATDTTLQLAFDEPVQTGLGNITVHLTSDNSVVETVAINSAATLFAGNTVTIRLPNDLAENTGHYINVASGAITDMSSNANAFTGFTDTTSWRFTTGKFTTPSIEARVPINNAANVAVDANLVVIFDENIQAGNGNVTIHLTDDDSVVESIAIGSANVMIVDDTVTIDPSTTLAESTEYYVQIEQGAITDTFLNPFPGISNSADWAFTTGDFTSPVIVALAPADEAAAVAINTSLVATFDETVQPGAGTIRLIDASDDSVFATIAVPSPQVLISGDEVRIDPDADFELGARYYVQISAGTITDTATTPNTFAGIADSTTWRFTTDDNDGVPNDTEDQAPNGGDGNNDGIPDRLQPNVASFPSGRHGCFLTVSAPNGTLINNPATTAVPPEAPTGFQYPCRLVIFELTGGFVGDQANVELFVFPANPTVATYLTFNRETNTWNHDATSINTTMGSTRIQRTLTDGGPYDADGIADGVMTDLGAPGVFLPGSVRPIPTTTPWTLLVLGFMLVLAAQMRLRRY